MKPWAWRVAFATMAIALVGLLAWTILSGPGHPAALIRVEDASGNPIAGAVIVPDGLRSKPGPYATGHYGWRPDGPPISPAVTDEDGYAIVPYPRYVFEKIETGEISFTADHPDYVPDRPFRVVTTTPPAGAPWRLRVNYWLQRIQRKALLSRSDPVVLQQGAVLKLVITPNSLPKGGRLFAQSSGAPVRDTNFWTRPEPGVLVTRRMAPGTQTVRAVVVDSDERIWFSDVFSITAVSGATNDLIVDVRPGVAVRGEIDPSVPRPVRNGRVIVHIWPEEYSPQQSPPQWHAWTSVHDDGSFRIESLPAGVLEVVALCDGFVSTNGPGQFQTRYPQKHSLGTNDLAIVIGMERTARFEVQVMDDQGQPLPGARVSTWPNVRYGEWSSTILGNDCYNTTELLSKPWDRAARQFQSVRDFQGTSDDSGLAIVPNLPANVRSFAVEHERYVLPAVTDPNGGGKHRHGKVALIAGETNRISVQLEARDQSPITHY